MSISERRIKILTSAEIADLFEPPAFSVQDQRVFFSPNDVEIKALMKIRDRSLRCMFVVLLGYFKVKPIVLSPAYHQVKQDLKYVYQTVLPGPGLRPFTLDQKSKVRLYHRILKLTGFER